MENNIGNNMPPMPEQNQVSFGTPIPPSQKKWYQHKGIITILILGVLTVLVSWLVLSKKPNGQTNLVAVKSNVATNLKTYTDKENDFSLKYPPTLYFVPDRYYSQASSTGKFYIQSEPAPQLFEYYYDANNKLTMDSKPYHRSGFTIEVQPAEYGSSDGSVDFINQQIAQQNDCKGNLTTVDVSGINSYEYNLTGENSGDLILVVPYSVGKYVKLHFKTSYDPNSSEYKNALQTFKKVLSTFKFTNTKSLADLEQVRAQAVSQITWQKHSNQFIEFEYSSDFELGKEKIITEHKPQPNGKDMYGFIGLSLSNDIVDSGSINIAVFPNISQFGDEQFAAIQKDFDADKSEPTDSFTFTTVDGLKASFAHKERFNHFDTATCQNVSRLGSNRVDFFTKNYTYEINLTWLRPENNSPESILQKEFQRFLSSFRILNKQ